MLSKSVSDLIEGQDNFEVWIPGTVDLIEKADENIEDTRPIGGWCSTERLDRQGEIVLARGLDFSEFVEHGFFNDNHKQETDAALGVPNLAELRKNRWWTEGNLIKGYPPADKVWQLAVALHKSGLDRRLGFSIEGKVQERGSGNRIIRAKIRHVAITNSPVNTDCTWDVLTKAFCDSEEVTACAARRVLAEKAVALGQGGDVLVPESLEGASSSDIKLRHERSTVRKLTFDDAVKTLKSARPHYSWMTCERLTRLIFDQESRRN